MGPWWGPTSGAGRGTLGLVGGAARTDDLEVAELRRRLVALPLERQARLLVGLLTPGLRLRVLAENVRHQVGPLNDDEEALAEREVDDAVRDVRRKRASSAGAEPEGQPT